MSSWAHILENLPDYVWRIVMLSGTRSLLITAMLISRAVDPVCMLSSNVCGVRKILWIREWLPTPVFLLGDFHTQRSLVGYSSWGHKELDMTERLTYIHTHTHTHTHTCLTVCLIYLSVYLSIYLSISSLSLGLDFICGIFWCRKAFNFNELNVLIFFIFSILFLTFSSIVFVLCFCLIVIIIHVIIIHTYIHVIICVIITLWT